MSANLALRQRSTEDTAAPVRYSLFSRLAPEWAARRVARHFFKPPRTRHDNPFSHDIITNAAAVPVYHNLMRLHGYRWGATTPGTPSVLLVHDWGKSAALMTPFVTPLVALGLRVVAFDAPAHGSSPRRRSHPGDMSLAVQCALEQHGPFSAIIAHGQGCNAAIHALRGLPAYRPAALVCLDPAPDLHERVNAAVRHSRVTPLAETYLRDRIAMQIGTPLADFAASDTAYGFDLPGLVVQSGEVVRAASTLAEGWLDARLLALDWSHDGLLVAPDVHAALLGFFVETLELRCPVPDCDLTTRCL